MKSPWTWYKERRERLNKEEFERGWEWASTTLTGLTPLQREAQLALNDLGNDWFDKGALAWLKQRDEQDNSRLYRHAEIMGVIEDLKRGSVGNVSAAGHPALDALERELLRLPRHRSSF